MQQDDDFADSAACVDDIPVMDHFCTHCLKVFEGVTEGSESTIRVCFV